MVYSIPSYVEIGAEEKRAFSVYAMLSALGNCLYLVRINTIGSITNDVK